MQVSRRRAIALLSTAALVGSATAAASAVGHDGGSGGDHGGDRPSTLLRATLAPSVPSDPMLHGVKAGGAPWVLGDREVRLNRDGGLQVRVRGLVIPVAPGNGTPGPVMTVSASLFCGNDATPVGTTPQVAISRSGDARMDRHVSLTAKCLAPVVLVQPNGSASIYIAADGFAA